MNVRHRINDLAAGTPTWDAADAEVDLTQPGPQARHLDANRYACFRHDPDPRCDELIVGDDVVEARGDERGRQTGFDRRKVYVLAPVVEPALSSTCGGA